MCAWLILGDVRPSDLVDARLELHWAAQVLASFGQTLGEPQADDSHRSMTWDERVGGLVTAGRHGPSGLALALRPSPFALETLSEDGATASLPLRGRTLAEAYAWAEAQVAEAGDGASAVSLDRPEFEIPHHAVADGAPFTGGPDGALEEVARWFGSAHALLQGVRRSEGAAPVRCWPHHFDIATLLPVEGAAPGGEERSVGVGMTPGDMQYPEPYLYVTPWPYPAEPALPGLPHGGRWHAEGWLGAVLTGTDLVDGGSAAEQEARAARFAGEAVAACRELLSG